MYLITVVVVICYVLYIKYKWWYDIIECPLEPLKINVFNTKLILAFFFLSFS